LEGQELVIAGSNPPGLVNAMPLVGQILQFITGL
jgi:hypothetical protein